MTDEDLAAHLAEEAGRLLLEQRNSSLLEGSALGHVADQVANAFILTGLAEWRPGDAELSEESPDAPARLGRSRCWIIDPLDGTREYGEGRPDWAVHVALAVDGVPKLGAVAVPALGRLFRSDAVATPALARERPVMLVSRTRPPAESAEIAALLGALGAGLHASRLDGAPLVYNQPDSCIPDLLIGRTEYAGRVLGFCRQR